MVNGLIIMLAAMILLVVLLYWNTLTTTQEADHHAVLHATPHPEAAAVSPVQDTLQPAKKPGPDPADSTLDPTDLIPDDLRKIEGIGPKIAELLTDGGIPNYAALAAADVDRLREILAAGGSRYRLADPTSWPEQARLAAAGDWDQLATLQDSLSGGRKAAS